MSEGEGHPLFSIMLSQSQFVGPGEALNENMDPLPEQFDIKPGDKCLAATANTMLEEDFTVLAVIEPDSRPEDFPNWEDRVTGLETGSSPHVLAEWFSTGYPVGDIGWFPRLKLIKITEEQYQEAVTWRTEGFPDVPPKWIEETFTRYTDSIAHLAPETVPVLVRCEKCGARDVEIHISGRKRFSARAGELKRNEKTVYIPINDSDENLHWSAHLLCKNCGSTAVLEDDDWDLPPR
jgi:hypothetical protein